MKQNVYVQEQIRLVNKDGDVGTGNGSVAFENGVSVIG